MYHRLHKGGLSSLKAIHGPQAKNIECLPRLENVIWIKPGHKLGVCDYNLPACWVVVSSCIQPGQFADRLRVSSRKSKYEEWLGLHQMAKPPFLDSVFS